MTQGQIDSSGGELSSFLHLTGWRPLILALVAGLAGAAGVFLALQEPPQFQARYVLNASLVSDNDITAGELGLVVEQIVSTASFPEVEQAVQERTGLIIEDDYDLVVNQGGGANININVVADDPNDANNVAIETGIEAVSLTIDRQIAGVESSRNQLLSDVAEIDSRIAELTVLSGGINPTNALDNAEAALLQRRADEINPPTENVVGPDGTITEQQVELTGPTADELEDVVNELSPIAREFTSLRVQEDQVNGTLSARDNSIRELESAITLIETERETSLVIRQVETEETSKISGLLTGLLIFAVPVALLMILIFTIFDLIRGRGAKTEHVPVEEFDAAGEIEPAPQRALPESTIRRPLTVVDEAQETDILAVDEDIIDVVAKEDQEDLVEEASSDDDDDEPPSNKKNKKRSKDGRWGREASTKAG